MAQGAAASPHPSRSRCQLPRAFPAVLTGRDGERGHRGLRGTPALHVVGGHLDVVSRALRGGKPHLTHQQLSQQGKKDVPPQPSTPVHHEEY